MLLQQIVKCTSVKIQLFLKDSCTKNAFDVYLAALKTQNRNPGFEDFEKYYILTLQISGLLLIYQIFQIFSLYLTK